MRTVWKPVISWWTLIVLCLGATLLPGSAAAQASNPIVLENQQPGNAGWDIDYGRYGTDNIGQIKGYASAVSVNKGESVTFYVSVNTAQTYTIDVYRIGWYQGLGGRLMQHIGPLNGVNQGVCPMTASTGLIECRWAPAYTLVTQTSWTSGEYVAVLTNAQNWQNYIMFTVRDDSRVAAFLYQQPVTTYQAYNNWPNDNSRGKSLYAFNSYGANTQGGTPAAVKVSFDRPYLDDGSGGDFRAWEVNYIRWLEKSGYDVTYATDVDTHINGARLLNYRGLLSVGHDEYWSKQMYDSWIAARDAGVNLAFMGANDIYWQIRFESSTTGTPNRVVVCWRETDLDPNPDPALKTILWRDVGRPEQALIGVQWGAIVPWSSGTYQFGTYRVMNSSNWVYAGTGFTDSSTVPGIVGYEADRQYTEYAKPAAVPGTYVLLSQSTFSGGSANSSIYQALSGSWVFATGTMDWGWALDNYNNGYNTVNAGIQRATKNVLDRFAGSTTPDFTLGASPASQTVLLGGSTSYSVTITPSNGFNGSVTLSVAGLPANTTGTFTPNPATSTSSLSVNVGANTTPGTYPLTITGVSGSLTHTASATLVIPAPNFTLAATPSSQTVLLGGSTSYNLTITASNGFNSAVTLSVTGLPANTTGTFTTNPATAASSLSVNVGANTTPGTYTLTITGVGGSLTRTTTATLVIPTPDFTLGASPGSRTALVGTSTSYDLTITPSNGFSSAVTLSVTGLPANVTGSFTPNPATTTASLSVNVGANAAPGTYMLTVTGVAGSLTRTATVTLVIPTPDFTMSASPSSQTVPQGNSASYGITITPSNGFSSSVNLSVSGLPANASSSFTINPATTTSSLSITAAGNTPAGTYTLTITGVSGSLTRTSTVTFVVTSPDFSMTPSPSSQSVSQGGSASYGLTITASGGFAGAVTLSVSGLPAGANGTFTTNPATTTSTLNVTTDATTPIGNYTLTITGVGGSLTRTTTVTLGVALRDFSLSATPASQTIPQAGSGNYGVTVDAVGGFNDPVTFSVSGLPAGATGTFTPSSATTSSTLAVAVSGSTVTGTYTLTITGVSGSLSHTATVTLVVSPRDFSLSATPSSQTIPQAGSGNYGVTVSAVGGFNDPVTLSVSGLPAGATGTFTPNPATTTSTLAVAVGGSTATGTYTLTITGDSGSLTHTATVTLVVSPRDFSLGATPASQTVLQGASANYGVTISGVGGFNDAVTLSIGGLPAGATGTFTPNPATTSSTLAVATSAGTPTGTYILTVTGVSGSLSHAATVSLTVSATPPPPSGVILDAVGPGAGGASTTSGSSLSWTHVMTTTGANLLLTVGVAVGAGNDAPLSLAVTYGGVPMTSAGIVHSNNTTQGYVQMFYLKAPPTGANTVQVTLTGGTATMEGGSVSFTGVDQITPVRNITTNFGSSTTPTVTVASAPGDMVVNAFASGCNGTITSANTLHWLAQVNCATAAGNGGQSTAAGAASVVMSYTIPSDWWSIIGMDVVGVSGPPAPFDFSLSNSGNKALPQSSATSNTISATWVAGVTEAVAFTVSGLPAGVTASYNPASCSPTCTTTLSLTADATAAPGTSTITVTGTSASVTRTTTFDLTVTTPDVTPPTVTFTAPASGAKVSGTAVAVSATATDDIGVSGVQFKLDGVNLGAEDTTAPYSVTWNTTSVANGSHQLSAVGRDAAGNTTTSTITVTVANPVPYFPSGYTVSLGTYVSGTVASLTADDNNFLVVSSATSGTTQQTTTEYQVSGVVTPTRLDYQIRRKSSASSTTVVVSAFNYVTGLWTQLSSANVGTGESTVNLAITSSAASYVSGGNALIRISSSKTTAYSLSAEIVKLTATP